MLEFTVDHPLPDAISNRFVTLVQRLLPPGWRFSLDPMPRFRLVFGPISLYPTTILDPGVGRLVRFDEFGTMEQATDAWRRRFREALAGLIASGAIRFELMADDIIRGNQVFSDSFVLQVIDVSDLERMPPIEAAAALTHALEEGRNRPAVPTTADFDNAHRRALLGPEARIMGGERLEAEVLTRPRNINTTNPPLNRTFEMWVPYQLTGGLIRAVVMVVRERTILRSRMAAFANIAQFRSSVPPS